MVRVFNDRGSYRCKAVVERARAARASSTASACGGASSARDGTNVNELTHQRLTDIGRAPSFYDCLVEVERDADAGAGVRRGARVVAAGFGGLAAAVVAAAASCLTSGCRRVGYYAQSVGGHLDDPAGGAPGAALARRSGDERRR